MYRIKIFRDTKNLIEAVVSGETMIELAERYYLYRKMHKGGCYFIEVFVDDELGSREVFDRWYETFNKFCKEKSRLKNVEEDFQ
jgi:hypothetical protein